MIRRISIFFLTIALFLFPSVKYSFALDGADADYFGFPLPWNSDSLISSAGKDIYLVPLVLDLVLLCVLSLVVVNALARFGHRLNDGLRLSRQVYTVAIAALWVWGLCCLIATMIICSFNSTWYWWPSPGPLTITKITISIGY